MDDLRLVGEVVHWRGPAPWYFVAVPAEACELIAERAREVTYGWGAVPVTARIGATSWETSLFPKDGRYLVPVKAVVRRAEGVSLGDRVEVHLVLGRG